MRVGWYTIQYFIDHSPLFHADKINTPLLLLHGSEDDNVTPGESQQLFTALSVLNRPVEMVMFPGEGHGISGSWGNRVGHRTMILKWFDRYCRGDGVAWTKRWEYFELVWNSVALLGVGCQELVFRTSQSKKENDMAGAAKKWFIGCGIGCGLFLLLAVGAGTIGYFGVREAMDRGEEIEAGFETLRAEYGDTSDFVPDPTITVSSSRMAAFLAARETMAPMRKEAGDVLRTLDDQEVDGKKPGWMQKARAGINLIPAMMGFIEDRNQAMLDAGIGFGEYLYIYTLVYYNYLDMPVADGPSFTISSDDHDEDQGPIRWSTNDSDDYSAEKREKRIRRYLHGVQLKMARNQLEEMDRRGGFETERALLVEEIGYMEAESLRLLWETGLPENLRASFELYRQELADSYDPMTNVFESGLVEND